MGGTVETTINRIYSGSLITVNENSVVNEVEQKMNNYNIRHMPVVNDENYSVGIISKSDYIALRFFESGFRQFLVKQVMSSPVKAVSKNTSVRQLANLFTNKKISSAVVVDNQDVVGIVTAEDLIKLLANKPELKGESELMDLAALAEEGWISNTIAQ